MKTKKAIKKIAALAGSALMVASTFGAGLAAVKDLPTPFVDSEGVFDAYVVVGANAGISDLVGAVEVAAAFAQNAKISAGEGSVIEKNVTPGILESSSGIEQLWFGTGAIEKIWSSANDGFDWLLNETIDYNDTEYEVHSYLKIGSTVNKLQPEGDFGWTVKGGIVYSITFNSSLPIGFDQFDFLGNNYQVVDWDNAEKILSLGQIEEVEMTLNEPTEVGGIATITATDIDTIHSRVRILVEDLDGEEISNEWYSESNTYDNDTLGLKFTVDSFYYSIDGTSSVTLNWETSGMILENNEPYEPTTSEGNWTLTVEGDANGFYSLAIKSPGTFNTRFPKEDFVSGEKVSLLDGYFEMTYGGIVTADASDDEPGEFTSVTVVEEMDEGSASSGSAGELVYTNTDGEEISVDFSWIKGIDLDPTDKITEAIYMIDLETPVFARWWNYTTAAAGLTTLELLDETSGTLGNLTGTAAAQQSADWVMNSTAGNMTYKFYWSNATSTEINITPISLAVNGEFFDTNLTYSVSGNIGTVTLTEPNGETIVAKYDFTDEYGILNETYYNTDKSIDDGDTLYSTWGSSIDYDSGFFSVEYPETRRYAKITVGRSTTETETVAVGDEIPDSDWTLKAGGGDLIKAFEPKFAYMDTEKATPDKPVILIGGPAINALVSGMGNETWTLSDWREEVNGTRTKENRALIDLVEDAFSTYDALVVAGYEAVDTRIAARLLAKELMYGGTILGDVATDRAVLDTTDADGSAESYTAATLVE